MMKKTLTFNQLIKKNKAEILNDRDQLRKIELKIDDRRIKNSKY
jgi:hypothetical protein